MSAGQEVFLDAELRQDLAPAAARALYRGDHDAPTFALALRHAMKRERTHPSTSGVGSSGSSLRQLHGGLRFEFLDELVKGPASLIATPLSNAE